MVRFRWWIMVVRFSMVWDFNRHIDVFFTDVLNVNFAFLVVECVLNNTIVCVAPKNKDLLYFLVVLTF